MAVKRLFNDRHYFPDSSGNNAGDGYLLGFYLAGSSTPAITYNSSLGTVPNSNPMELDASGRLQAEVWVTTGIPLKVAYARPGATFPFSDPVWTEDNISGINDFGTSAITGQWVPSGLTPTYVSATSFTVTGDQRAIFSNGTALQIVDSGGTKIGYVKTATFGVVTTVTLDQNSAALANPISSVAYGVVSGGSSSSTPILPDTIPIRGGSADESKQWRVELDQNTTALTRVTTIPDYDHRMMTQTHGADIASATTTVLDTATGDLVDVTGTTTITALTLAEGRKATVRFTGILTLTNGASLLLPGAANITTAAGDVAMFRGYAAGVVRCVSYMRLSLLPHLPTAAEGSSLVLISSQSPSGVATVDFVDLLTSTYDEYELHVVALNPVTDAQDLWLRVGSASVFQAGATDYIWGSNRSTSAGANSVIGSTGDTKITTQINITNTAGSPQHLVIRLNHPTNSSVKKMFSFVGGYQQSAAGSNFISGAGYYTTSVNAFTSLRLLMSSGNISNAQCYLYGVKKS